MLVVLLSTSFEPHTLIIKTHDSSTEALRLSDKNDRLYRVQILITKMIIFEFDALLYRVAKHWLADHRFLTTLILVTLHPAGDAESHHALSSSCFGKGLWGVRALYTRACG